jgi:hypothetical protein
MIEGLARYWGGTFLKKEILKKEMTARFRWKGSS